MGPTNVIRVRGAREHNLDDLDVSIPRGRVTAVTGVSGAGKTSLVFDTLAAEAQRQLNELFSSFVRNRLPSYGRPQVDAIENLAPPVVVSQRRVAGNARSTVGTITDVWALMRLLYSRAATPAVGESDAFSFNSPAGMCPACEGLGEAITVDVDALIDPTHSLDDGAIQHPAFAPGKWYWKYYGCAELLDNSKPVGDYTEAEWEILLHGTEDEVMVAFDTGDRRIYTPYEGLVSRFTRLFVHRDRDRMSDRDRGLVDRFTSLARCAACGGQRLNAAARAARLDGHTIVELACLEITDLVAVLDRLPTAAGIDAVVDELVGRLTDLVTVGLGYLTLDRATTTLSGGESQRVKLVRHLHSDLVGMLYILDEPSIGLHPADLDRLTGVLARIADHGNTVLAVDHDPQMIAAADHVIDLGHGAGPDGGRIVYEGDPGGLLHADTATGQHLARRPTLKAAPRHGSGDGLTITAGARHNLHRVAVAIPTGAVTVVTGVAGAGKSTLTQILVEQHPDAAVVDQSPIATSRRSYPATHTGILDRIRRLFADATNVSPSLFSANSHGACPDCHGMGVVYLDLAFMDGVTTRCETCAGSRYAQHVLAHTWAGHRIDQILALTVDQAIAVFADHTGRDPAAITGTLRGLAEVGLGHLRLGQPLPSLSGGEAQRLRLAEELHRPRQLYVLDEPTTGLHGRDTDHLLDILDRLVAAGATIVIVEHNLDVICHADHIIDLGPGAGRDGGQVIFDGAPRQLLEHDTSPTARYLRAHLQRSRATEHH